MMRDDQIIKRFENDHTSMDQYWGSKHHWHDKQVRFVDFDDQWDPEAKKQRSEVRTPDGKPLPPRPTNVYNITAPFSQKVTNGVKKMRPAVSVMPRHDQAKDIAEIARGMVIAIQKGGEANEARFCAIDDQIKGGYGFYRITTDYEDPRSFDQEIKYERIEDATCVLWDEDSIKTSGSDVKKVMFKKRLSKEEFKAIAGEDWETFYKLGDGMHSKTSSAWGGEESPYITEYWFIEQVKEQLVKIKPEYAEQLGSTAFMSEVTKATQQEDNPFFGIDPQYLIQVHPNTGKPISRETHSRQVWRCKMCGGKVLQKQKWPGYWIPVFKINGRKKVSKNEIRYDSLHVGAMAPQKSYNYSRNAQLEEMSLAIKARMMAPKGAVPEDQRYKYQTSNVRNWDLLEWESYDEDGNPLQRPELIQPKAMDPAISTEVAHSAEEIKATMGIWGDFVGEVGAQRSGKAILAAAQESSDVVYDFAINVGMTIEHEGRVLLDLIPHVYNTARQVSYVGPDDKEKIIWINQQAKDENGNDYYHDLRYIKANLTVEMGPSDETKRVETRESMETFMKALPEFAEAFADLYAKEQDWRKSDLVAERMTKILEMKYPGLTKEKGEQEQQSPQLMQAQQIIDQQQQQLIQLAKENEDMKRDKTLDAWRVRIEEFKARTDRLKALSDSEAKEAKVLLDQEKLNLQAATDNLKLDQQDKKMAIDAGLKVAQNAMKQGINQNEQTNTENMDTE